MFLSSVFHNLLLFAHRFTASGDGGEDSDGFLE